MPNSEDSLAKWPCMSGIYLDHSIVEQKEKYVSGNLHQPVLYKLSINVDCLAKKLSTSGVHLDDSILDKRKTISIIAPTCAIK